MRIDRDRFPALFDDEIVTKNYHNILNHIAMKKMRDVIEASKNVVNYLAKPIIDPMLISYKKLAPHRKELHDSCRTIAYYSKAGNPHVLKYILLVEEDRINILGQTHFMVSDTKDFGMLFSVCVDRLENELIEFRSYPDVPPILHIEKHDNIMNVVLYTILSAELFINFAEVETKVMKPNSCIWDERGVNAIYNNKTNRDITVIDSTWYQNLVSSGAFNVRGHFRLQPFGPDRTKRRLQWISEFQKQGYTRKAKKESLETTNPAGNENH